MGNNYDGLNIFQEAKQREIDGMGYRARRYKVIWQSKHIKWQHITVEYGIRWSDVWQLFPVWWFGNNSMECLQIGIWKLYFSVSYFRAKSKQRIQFNTYITKKLREFYLNKYK